MRTRGRHKLWALFAVLLLLVGANAQGFWKCADGEICSTCEGVATPDDCAPVGDDCSKCCSYAEPTLPGVTVKAPDLSKKFCADDCSVCSLHEVAPIIRTVATPECADPPPIKRQRFKQVTPTKAHGLRAPPVIV